MEQPIFKVLERDCAIVMYLPLPGELIDFLNPSALIATSVKPPCIFRPFFIANSKVVTATN